MSWLRRDHWPRPWIIGHRGAAGLAPENTLAAFRAGLAAGADGVECDVQLTRDGVPVVFHDEDLQRLCGREGAIRSFSSAGLQDCRVLDSPEGVSEFATLCQQVAEWGCPFFVEVKDSHAIVPVLATLRQNLSEDHPVVIGSFHAAVVRVATAARSWSAMQLVAPEETDWSAARWQRLAESGVAAVGLPWPRLSRSLVGEIKSTGLAVWAWTVNDAAYLAELAAWGVDALITDYPNVAARVLSD